METTLNSAKKGEIYQIIENNFIYKDLIVLCIERFGLKEFLILKSQYKQNNFAVMSPRSTDMNLKAIKIGELNAIG